MRALAIVVYNGVMNLRLHCDVYSTLQAVLMVFQYALPEDNLIPYFSMVNFIVSRKLPYLSMNP